MPPRPDGPVRGAAAGAGTPHRCALGPDLLRSPRLYSPAGSRWLLRGRLRGGLRGRDVDAPPREASGETGVLPSPADGEGELGGVDGHVGGPGLRVQLDA